MRLHDARESFGGDTQGRRASHQFMDVVSEPGEWRSRCRDDRSPASTQIDESLITKPLIRVKDGVLVDVQCDGDIACCGQAVTGFEIPGEDVGPDGGCHLVVQRAGAVCVDANEHFASPSRKPTYSIQTITSLTTLCRVTAIHG